MFACKFDKTGLRGRKSRDTVLLSVCLDDGRNSSETEQFGRGSDE